MRDQDKGDGTELNLSRSISLLLIDDLKFFCALITNAITQTTNSLALRWVRVQQQDFDLCSYKARGEL